MAQIDPAEPCPCGSGKTFGTCHGPRVRKGPPLITEHLRLTVIAEPDPQTRVVFEHSGQGTVFFQGEAVGLSLDCGHCGAPLVEGLYREQVRGIVLRCSACGAHNDT